MEKNFVFLGLRSDVAKLLAAADVGLLMLQHEGFSNSILEYMASKLPTIATNIGGNIDSILDEKTDYLVPVDDPYAFARKIEIMMVDALKRKELGENAYTRVLDKFFLDRCVNQYEKLYENILSSV